VTNLLNHQSSSITKLLLEGDSGTGKTTALACLVEAGFKLRIWDYDNGLAALIKELKRRCPNKIENVEFETLRDQYTASAGGPMVKGTPKAFSDGLNLMDRWFDKTRPESWGPDYIVVIDSLTHLSGAAYNWSKLMHGALAWREGISQKGIDPRNIYQTAQKAVENMLALLTSASFATNLIVISHIKYTDREDGTTKGYPLSVGSALGPVILTYFNDHVLSFEQTGKGDSQRRIIRTKSTFMLDLKSATEAPSELEASNGLQKFFHKSVRSA
jgi:DNA polymerase III delta prime subunit